MSGPGDVVQAHDYAFRRFKENEFATYGRAYDAGGLEIMVLLERPFVDANNDGHRDRGVCRFQAGLYRCFLRKSHLNGGTGHRDFDVWEFEQVPDTDDAQIHPANFPWQLEGCCATGSAFGDVEYTGPTLLGDAIPREHGKMYPGVTGSEAAFKKFMKDSLALCAREQRDHIWVLVTDCFDAPVGSFA